MLQQTANQYIESLREPRNFVDIALVFLLVYALLRLIRGTRAAPMAAGIGGLALLYWAAARYDLATLEFILRPAPVYVGVAIIVLFQNEIRQALISFGTRVRMPFLLRHRGQFGEGVYDEIVLAATTLASTKTGLLIVIEGGVKMDAELSYDLLVTIFNPATPLHDGAVVIRGHRVAAAACFLPLTLNPLLSKDRATAPPSASPRTQTPSPSSSARRPASSPSSRPARYAAASTARACAPPSSTPSNPLPRAPPTKRRARKLKPKT